MKSFFIYTIMIVGSIFQLSLSHLFSFNNSSVDFVLVLTILVTYLIIEEYKVIAPAIGASIIVDIVTSQMIFISGVFLLIVWFIVFKYKYKVNIENKLAIIPISIISTVIYNVFLLIFKEFMGIPICINIAIYNIVVETILNTILIFILYILFAKRAFEKNRRKRIDVI